MSDYKYGDCECRGGGCQCDTDSPGPSAFSVLRDGKQLNVCSRCTLPGDTTRSVLWKSGDDVSVLSNYDELGAFLVEQYLHRSD